MKQLTISNFDGQRFFWGQSGYCLIEIQEKNGLIEITKTYPHSYSFMTDIPWSEVEDIDHKNITERTENGESYSHLEYDLENDFVVNLQLYVDDYDRYLTHVSKIDETVDRWREDVRDNWDGLANIGNWYWESFENYLEGFKEIYHDEDSIHFDPEQKPLTEEDWKEQIDNIENTIEEYERQIRKNLAVFDPKMDYEEYVFIPS